ncbi:hypothetical protein ACGFYZ_33490 [Streptomyces sp. NPDC048330]|uniref:hypothetical protein n=1 Tax=Streptomyces sp. NPDC048330 TaxID=3365533 RepID=UPI00371BEC93
MRSARILFAATATAGALALAVPGAYAITAGDWDKGDSAHSQDHDKPHGGMHTGGGALTTVSGDEWSKDHDKGGKYEKDHDKPHGGMHTGSGALSLVNADDWSRDKDQEKEEGGRSKENQQEEGGSKHDKPKGGMHTGGGGLANNGASLTGALVLAGGAAALVLYRRRQGGAAA